MKGWFWPADTWLSKPRPLIVSAKVPCVSSQARTQRLHTMHLLGSKVKYGFDSSFVACVWCAPATPSTTAPPAP